MYRCMNCENYMYREQQRFFDEIAQKLNVVCFRPNYHGKDRDANTVLFYTCEDHVHNCRVDRQPIQFSRSQAIDSRCNIDDKYIYRDFFWSFENTDVNGHLDYGFGNFGRIDLRGPKWREVLEKEIRTALERKLASVSG